MTELDLFSFPQNKQDPPKASNSIWTPSSLSNAISDLLEENFPTLYLRGEVSNYRLQKGSGHQYFSLKDEGAILSCVLFRGSAARIKGELREGMQIIACGKLSVYGPQGKHQMIVHSWEEDGIGKLQRQFEELKRKLQGEGLFDKSRKKALPSLPLKIGVITSPSGAAVRDMISILRRREWPGEMKIFPAIVQGDQGPDSVIRAIDLAESPGDLDLIVLARGGGSLEDLWTFNSENVVRRLAECNCPTISAIGHEIDFVLTDFVADFRAETPSGAAEWISSLIGEARDQLKALNRGAEQLFQRNWERKTIRLKESQRRIAVASPRKFIEQKALQWDSLAQRWSHQTERSIKELHQNLGWCQQRLLNIHPAKKIRQNSKELDILSLALARASKLELNRKQQNLKECAKSLSVISPKATLKRGYTWIENTSGRIITHRSKIKNSEKVEIVFQDGSITAKIEGYQS